MLKVSEKLKGRMLEKRQDAWLQEQVAVMRSTYPETCANCDDDAIATRIENLRQTAADIKIGVDANQQRFVHIAFQINDDNFHVSQEWATTIFAWDSDENMKLSACEQYLASK